MNIKLTVTEKQVDDVLKKKGWNRKKRRLWLKSNMDKVNKYPESLQLSNIR
jgi:uncharacterized membrane protein